MSDPIGRLNVALEGRYSIERELGEGGMARVYLADDLKHERKVALKVLKPEVAEVVGAERFLAEIKTTANLQHPHILPLFDSGEADSFLFYVMPYVEGESLRERLDREHQLPVDDAVRIATNVAEALDYAHRQGVIHRDIKPANVLLQDGTPVISDFGIALAVSVEAGGRLTETGMSLGTPHYMSPEQATGDQSVGPMSDIWALGCVLYEMLVGEPPYTGITPQAILGKILTGEPEPVTAQRKTAPAHIDYVVQRALAKIPADRFATGQEMTEALRGRVSVAPMPVANGPGSRWKPALIIVAGVLGAGVGWALIGRQSGTGGTLEQSVAVLPFENLSAEPEQEYFSAGLTEEIINALTQVQGLKVIAPTSAFAFQDSDLDVRTIADRLGVSNVVSGSVRKEGERIRVTAALIEAGTGVRRWSETFDRTLSGVFAIQDEIALAITSRLRVTLTGDQQTRLVTGATAHPQAHEAYLRGRHLWNRRTEESLRAAITQFQRAIELDPDYAEAYSGLADAYLTLDVFAMHPRDWEFEANTEQGIAAAREAISVDPDFGMARASLGFGLWSVGEWEPAVRELERAIELSPGYANAHHWLGVALWSLGEPEEALTHAETAHRLDPVSQIISWNLGRALLAAGSTEEAVAQYRETAELAPEWLFGWDSLARVLLGCGEHDEGLRAGQMAAKSTGVDAAMEAYRAVIQYRETGEPRSFADFDWNPHSLIWLHAHAGNVDRAIELFEAYVGAGAYGWAAMGHALYVSDLVREDPRYPALLAEAGITW